MTSRKPPSAAFWATLVVVVVALVGYPLSMGPAAWLAMQEPPARSRLPIVYWPIGWMMYKSFGVNRSVRWYVRLWSPRPYCCVVIPREPTNQTGIAID